MTDIPALLADFEQKLSAATDPTSPYDALYTLVDGLIGVRLFTFMTLDNENQLARRNYTSNPEAYPVSGTKPIAWNDWSEQVIKGREYFIGNTPADVAAAFFDHELIASLGCGSAVNMPVIVGDAVIGTLNLLHAEGHFTPERVDLLRRHVSLPAMAAYLTSAYLSKT